MNPLYIQIFHEGCPKAAPLVGTQEYPVHLIGYCDMTKMIFYFPDPAALKMFEGKRVNIWTRDLEDKIIRNVLFSKGSVFPRLSE